MTMTRAITLSIVPHAGINAPTMWKMLHHSWNQCQRAANEAVRQYFIGDDAALSTEGKTKLAKLPKEVSNAAYHFAREVAPDLPTTSISDICQRVRGKYLADRWASRVSMRQTGISFRRPLPLSIRAANWHFAAIVVDEKGRKQFGCTFPLLDLRGKDRPTFRFVIRTGADAAALEKIESGEWTKRTLEILPPGWDRRGPVKVKVVYQRPRPAELAAAGTLLVWTGAPALLNCSAESDERPFTWNLRWLRGRMVAYDRARQMRSEDRKFERRMPSRRRFVMNREGGRAQTKKKDRVKTEIQSIAAQVVARAERMGLAAISYDDSDRSWFEHFPWHQLKEAIRQAAESRGIGFLTDSSPAGGTSRPGRCSADDSGGSPCASTAETKPCAVRSARKGRVM